MKAGDASDAQRFLVWAGAVFAALCVCVPGVAWFYLKGIGELSLSAVVETQARNPRCLFGSGIEQDNYTYKLALYQKVRPDIVVVGSSRVMQIRGRYFSGSFVNMGGAVGSTLAFANLVEAMLEVHRPRLVVIGVDFWWFNEAYSRNKNKPPPSGQAYVMTLERLKLPYYWLVQGKIQLRDLISAVGFDDSACRFGVMAKQLADGFGSDGSYYRTSLITGRRLPDQPGFSEVLQRIAQGKDRFEWGDAVSAEDIARFRSAVAHLENAGATVIMFMPPLSRPAYDAILSRSKQYRFLTELPRTFLQVGLNVHDYTDPARVSAGDCEFLDGYHGGEVAYARIVARLAQQHRSVAASVRGGQLNAVISTWTGFAMAGDSGFTRQPEVDFLGMGCRKSASVAATGGRP